MAAELAGFASSQEPRSMRQEHEADRRQRRTGHPDGCDSKCDDPGGGDPRRVGNENSGEREEGQLEKLTGDARDAIASELGGTLNNPRHAEAVVREKASPAVT